MLTFQCPHCGGPFQISAELAGQGVVCPHCQNGVMVPGAEPPVTTEPPAEPLPPPVSAEFADSPVLPQNQSQPFEFSAAAPTAHERLFVIPTLEGGQAVIREPTRIAVYGSRARELRDLSAAEKSARRSTKNLVMFGFCAVVLVGLLWYLMTRGAM